MLGFSIWRISGSSMTPLIPPDSFVLTSRWLALKPGCQAIFDHPNFGLMIKTLVSIDNLGRYWFDGENSHSVSCQQIGPVSSEQVRGRVVKLIMP